MNKEKTENDSEYYRNNFFLDPNGSNIELLANNTTNMLANLLEMYTGTNVHFDEVTVERKDDGMQIAITGNNKRSIIENIAALSNDPFTIPEHSTPLETTVDNLSAIMKPEFKFNDRVLGQMHPHDCMPSFIAGLAGKFLNGNTIAEEVSPVVTNLERQVVGWLASEFGYEVDKSWLYSADSESAIHKELVKRIEEESIASGNMTAGGTTANFTALLVARNKAYGNEVRDKGMTGKEQGVVIGSEFAHYSHKKLCSYAGIGADNYIGVKTKDKRIDASDLSEDGLRAQLWSAAEEKKPVIAVFATAGTTETGSIDDLNGIANLLDEFKDEFGYKPHFHVDAAHGGGFVFHDDYSPKKGGKLAGIERADSITVDPHKMLFTHYNAGCVIFKDKKDHLRLKQEAKYLFKEDGKLNLGQYRVEGSMGLEATLQTWTTLYSLGREGMQAIQQHALDLTQYLKRQLEAQEHIQLLNDPAMNLLCFRYNNPAFSHEENNRITLGAQKLMHDAGKAYISNEEQLHRENGEERHVQAFRAVVMHPWTTQQDIDLAVKEVNRGIEEMIGTISQSPLRLVSESYDGVRA